MTTKSEIYAKAAEIIVRDGQTKHRLFDADRHPYLDSRSGLSARFAAAAQAGGSVCAIGACIRAEYELTGEVATDSWDSPGDWYRHYGFRVDGLAIHAANDDPGTTAEDIALLLKKKAADEL